MKKKNPKNIQIKVLTKLLEKYSGKKVSLKEADEVSKNQAVNNLHFIETSINNSIDKLNEISELPVLNKERNILINKISLTLNKTSEFVNQLIENITGTVVEDEEALNEDLEMTTDQILKNPQQVKKLTDKKLDIKVIDPNNLTSSSSSTNKISY